MGNPGLALKPDMYAEVEFTVEDPPRLTVPAEAVLDAGQRKVVYVDRGNGYSSRARCARARAITYRVEILAGLKAGERVVSIRQLPDRFREPVEGAGPQGRPPAHNRPGSEGEK